MNESRLPPSNLEAEESILGGILLDSTALDRIFNTLHPDAFYVPAHRQIYRAALKLRGKGQPTDLMTVTTWLTDQGALEKVGGISKLAQLVDRTVSAVNIDRYAELVMDKYLRRRLIGAAHQVLELGYDTTTELEEVFSQSEQSLFEVSNQKLSSHLIPNSEVAQLSYDDLGAGSPIYPTGLYDLDGLIVGFEPGTLTILAGRPSMGKTYAATFLAMQVMLSHRLPAAFFSLEMTAKQLEYRLWSLISALPYYQHLHLFPVSSDRLRRHRAGLTELAADELGCLAKVLGAASELPLYISDSRGITVTGIASECRRLIGERGQLGLVVVDYLQMMASESGGNRSYELGDVARGLYKMAGDLNVPVLALSQISRAVEGRNDKRPTMADLSQSGILEMVADTVILAYRDDYYNPDTPDREVLELIVGKARHGSTGVARFLFDKSYGLLKSLG
jgi:replicative DNA helicase